jgi:hypothetical protein
MAAPPPLRGSTALSLFSPPFLNPLSPPLTRGTCRGLLDFFLHHRVDHRGPILLIPNGCLNRARLVVGANLLFDGGLPFHSFKDRRASSKFAFQGVRSPLLRPSVLFWGVSKGRRRQRTFKTRLLIHLPLLQNLHGRDPVRHRLLA